jgi:hypothetical protein
VRKAEKARLAVGNYRFLVEVLRRNWQWICSKRNFECQFIGSPKESFVTELHLFLLEYETVESSCHFNLKCIKCKTTFDPFYREIPQEAGEVKSISTGWKLCHDSLELICKFFPQTGAVWTG